MKHSVDEAERLLDYLNAEERFEMTAALRFLDLAEDRPDSTWGPVSEMVGGGSRRLYPGEKEEMTSAYLTAVLNTRVDALLTVAFRRRVLRGFYN
jgi:hypothetical protein